jgi:hypothetical protein
MENLSEGDNLQEELIHNRDVKKEDADEFADEKLPVLTHARSAPRGTKHCARETKSTKSRGRLFKGRA